MAEHGKETGNFAAEISCIVESAEEPAADKNGNNFYPVFQIIAKRLYANGEKIPHYYEEALLLIAEQEKEILEKYSISQESRERYLDFMGMVQQGRTNAAKRKYPDTFWAYIF